MNEFFQLVSIWPWLQAVVLVYLAVVLLGGFGFFRFSRRCPDSVGSLRYRLLLGAYLGVVFTPSLLTDWFLFAVPAPAFIGFLAVIPGIGSSDQRLTLLLATSLYHLAPILGGSFVFYLASSLYFHLRTPHPNSTNFAQTASP